MGKPFRVYCGDRLYTAFDTEEEAFDYAMFLVERERSEIRVIEHKVIYRFERLV